MRYELALTPGAAGGAGCHHRLQACDHYWPALALLEDGVATTVC